MNYKQVVETLAAEIKKRGLYDAVSSRVDTIIEAAAMLPQRDYTELSRAASEILILISESGNGSKG